LVTVPGLNDELPILNIQGLPIPAIPIELVALPKLNGIVPERGSQRKLFFAANERG